ncbi:MAG: BREX-4 system phosphatase PglZ [Eubacterium sp.]|nr:BREX-4 system phosphatase PglZ [Eubacterium sp.]MCM1213831.1 BREX-4 system phosphatase PglZ [Lachnospiraceae bacterium]MCM1237951.1 BREX-4 system phosphatase PglZ [Lachnospiraceae bacterium]
MEMNSLIEDIKDDLRREGSYDRYPVRFFSMKYEDETANKIIKLQRDLPNVEIYDIKDLLVHEDAWITPDSFRKAIDSLNPKKNFIVVGFSEYARFLSQPEFISLLISCLGIENPADHQKRRIYILCFALYNQVKNTVKQYHKRADAYNPFINETDVEDLPRIYFVNSDLDIDIKSNEISSSEEWFGMWRNSAISTNKPIICSSETLTYFYAQASPDNVYNIQSICTYQDILKYLYYIEDIRPYEKKKDEYFKKIIAIIKKAQTIPLSQLILNRLNAQSIDEKNIYSLWKFADTFDRWLIQNYILLNTGKDLYLYQVLDSLDDLTENAFIERIYNHIFVTNNAAHLEERKTIISSVYKSEREIKFTDRLIAYYKKYVAEIVHKKTAITLDDIDFTKENDSLVERKAALEEAFSEALYPYLTAYSGYERKLIIWLYRLGAIRDGLLEQLYPQLAFYILDTVTGAEPEEFSEQFDEYFADYRKCRLGKLNGGKYNENLKRWNVDENAFFSWYLNNKINYPEMYIKMYGGNATVYVLDGVGAEFLGLIIKLLRMKGFSVERMCYAKAHLPSITSVAKEYYKFDNEWITDFDEKVIHGGIYYHVDSMEKSLSVIEDILDRILLKAGDDPFVITADHGASIGHKLLKKEKKYDFEKSEHDGRCYLNKDGKSYPASNDYVRYDSEIGNQWIVALNQQSLYNNSKYSVHGGGTPEEVIVPVIYARKGKAAERSFNVKPINLKVSGLQKEIEVKIFPVSNTVDVKLLAKDGTDTTMTYCGATKTWKGTLKRGIEQDITIRVNSQDFLFKTIPSTKMGDDLFDD